MNIRFLMTVSQMSSSERFIVGILLVMTGLLLLRFMPVIHERYFGQRQASKFQLVAGPIFVIAMGVLLAIGGIVRLF